MIDPLDALVRTIGYEFINRDNLKLALTHRSASGKNNNERLEFLGDSILNFVIANYLFERFPDADEGQMSRLRAKMVRGQMLAEIAKEMHLGDYLLLGTGELKSGGFKRNSILADAVEAIIGAIYLEAGLEVVRERVLTWFSSRLELLSLKDTDKDAKTRLQEYLQSRQIPLPAYEVLSIEGKAHEQTFLVKGTVEVSDAESVSHEAKAASRRKAEQQVAALLLQSLGVDKSE